MCVETLYGCPREVQERFQWLNEKNIRDAAGRRPSSKVWHPLQLLRVYYVGLGVQGLSKDHHVGPGVHRTFNGEGRPSF